MKRKLKKILYISIAILFAIVLACNLFIVQVSKGKCYDDIDAIPHNTFGLLLGTGRSSKPSPYYEARVQAAIDLYKAKKIDYVIVSGEKLYEDYNEVDSMLAALKIAEVPVEAIDYHGTSTFASLNTHGDVWGYSYPSLTIISQYFHNQRAVFYGAILFDETPVAYNAKDTDIWYWNAWQFCRETLVRTKAVILLPYTVISNSKHSQRPR